MRKRKVCLALLSMFCFLMLCGCTAAQPDAPSAEVSQGPTWQEQYDLGVRYLSEGNYEEAILTFTAAIEIDPKRALAYVGRGDAYVLSGETEENLTAAKADYEKAIELDETNAEAYLGLADVYIRQGDYEKAREILEQGLEKTGQHEAIRNKLEEMDSGTITDSSKQPRRRNYYNEDGTLHFYLIHAYDEHGRLGSTTLFDGQGNQTYHVEEQYDQQGNNVVTLRGWQSEDNNNDTAKLDWAERNFDEHGNVIFERYYRNDELLTCTSYTYDGNGACISRSQLTEEGEIVTTTSMTYDEHGNRTGEKTYLQDGTASGSREYKYDQNGNKMEEKWYNAGGNLYWRITWNYEDNGRMLKQSTFDEDGLHSYILYHYDANGTRIKTEHYDKDGNLTSYSDD